MKYPSDQAERFILRFERPGHRDELKSMATRDKRSLNKQILMLIEAGLDSVRNQEIQPQGAKP